MTRAIDRDLRALSQRLNRALERCDIDEAAVLTAAINDLLEARFELTKEKA